MAETLPPEQQASYSAIIDEILANSDLETISAKRIRKGLQEQVDYDITPQKDAITELIMARFDKISSKQATNPAPEPAPTTNGVTAHPDRTSSSMSPTKRKASTSASPPDDASDDLSDVADSPRPPKKIKKTKAVETDEQIAKRMQAELNAPSARSTRGGGSVKKKAVVKKGARAAGTPSKTKKKSKAKIRSEDDSEVESGSGDDKPAKQRTGGFHKPYTLSEPLSEMLGQATLSRPQTVKQIWNYVKERDLQDPNDKRQIRCDDAMKAVFRQDKVHMFTMNKLLAQHLYAADE